MKQLNKDLCDFINTYNLDTPDKGICFDARLYLFTHFLKTEAVSEIQIITIQHKALDVLYVLDTIPSMQNFPSMLIVKDYELSYDKNYGLTLKGWCKEYDFFTLVIEPVNTSSSINFINRNNLQSDNKIYSYTL